MSFFHTPKELTEAQVIENKIHTYMSHVLYNRFNDKIERGGKIFEEELNELVGQMHKDIKTLRPEMKVGWVKKMAFDYIINEWGMHGHFEVSPSYKPPREKREPSKPSKPSETSLAALAAKFNRK